MEFNDRFPSFQERRASGGRGKSQVAAAAARFIQAGGTYFLDAGTTIHAMASFFLERPALPATIVTSNLPVGELLAGVQGLQVFLTAGQILGRQSVLLGETARRSLEFWNFDIAFLSAEAANAEGVWNSQDAIVEQQLVAMRQSARTLFCIDSTKLGKSAPKLLSAWSGVDTLLTDATPARLGNAGILPSFPRVLGCDAVPPLPAAPLDIGEALPVHYL